MKDRLMSVVLSHTQYINMTSYTLSQNTRTLAISRQSPMSHKPVCPRCDRHPVLVPKTADAGILSFANPVMLNCPNCHRWWRHISRDNECGLVGTIKTIGPESFTPCPQQSSLF